MTSLAKYRPGVNTRFDDFCRRLASHGSALLNPTPSQLVAVNLGMAFGKTDLEEVQYLFDEGSEDPIQIRRRERMWDELDKLRDSEVLFDARWNEFLECIRLAGFRKQNTRQLNKDWLPLLYSIFLVGRGIENIDRQTLVRRVARLVFEAELISAINPYAQHQFEDGMRSINDIIVNRASNVSNQFSSIATFNRANRITWDEFLEHRIWGDWRLTPDFWSRTLPAFIEHTSSEHCWNVFAAALVILDTPVLFGARRLGDLLDRDDEDQRGARVVNLFRRNSVGNRDWEPVDVVNRVFVDSTVPALPPVAENMDKWRLATGLNSEDWSNGFDQHGFPADWHNVDYARFRASRSKAMTSIILQAYDLLAYRGDDDGCDLEEIIAGGESNVSEFKARLRLDGRKRQSKDREYDVMRTIAGFLNSEEGGTLIIGVNNDGDPATDQDGQEVGIGLDLETFGNEDRMMTHVTNLLHGRMTQPVESFVSIGCKDYKGVRVMVVRCRPSRSAIYYRVGNANRFFLRFGPTTRELDAKETQDYIEGRLL